MPPKERKPKSKEAKDRKNSSTNSSNGSSGPNRVTTLANLQTGQKGQKQKQKQKRKATKDSKGNQATSGSDSSGGSRGSSLYRSQRSKTAGQDKKQGADSGKSRTLRSSQPSDQTEILLRFTNGRRKVIRIKLKDKLSAIRKYIEKKYPQLNEDPFVFLSYTNDNEIIVVNESQTVQESGLENSVLYQHRKLDNT